MQIRLGTGTGRLFLATMIIWASLFVLVSFGQAWDHQGMLERRAQMPLDSGKGSWHSPRELAERGQAGLAEPYVVIQPAIDEPAAYGAGLISLMIQLLDSDMPLVRRLAASVLAGIGAPAAEPLLEALSDAGSSTALKEEILDVLERIACAPNVDAGLRERINRALTDNGRSVQMASPVTQTPEPISATPQPMPVPTPPSPGQAVVTENAASASSLIPEAAFMPERVPTPPAPTATVTPIPGTPQAEDGLDGTSLAADILSLRGQADQAALNELLAAVAGGEVFIVEDAPYLCRTIYGLDQDNQIVLTGIRINPIFLRMPREVRQSVLLHEANHIAHTDLIAAALMVRRQFQEATGIDLEETSFTPEDFYQFSQSTEQLGSSEIELFKQYLALKVHLEYLAWADELRFFEGRDFDLLLAEAGALQDEDARSFCEQFYLTHQYLYGYATHGQSIEGFDERRLKLAITDYFFSRDLPRVYALAMLVERREHGDRTIGGLSVVGFEGTGYMLRIERLGGSLEQDPDGLTPVPSNEYLTYLTDLRYYTLTSGR